MNASTLKLQAIVGRIFASRRITRRDQQILMSLITCGLNEVDNALINQVHEGLKRGVLRVVD